MKKILALAAVSLLLTACHSIRIPTPYGVASVDSFGQKTRITEMSWSKDGTLTLKGYNNDQTTLPLAAFQAGLEYGKKLAVP